MLGVECHLSLFQLLLIPLRIRDLPLSLGGLDLHLLLSVGELFNLLYGHHKLLLPIADPLDTSLSDLSCHSRPDLDAFKLGKGRLKLRASLVPDHGLAHQFEGELKL